MAWTSRSSPVAVEVEAPSRALLLPASRGCSSSALPGHFKERTFPRAPRSRERAGVGWPCPRLLHHRAEARQSVWAVRRKPHWARIAAREAVHVWKGDILEVFPRNADRSKTCRAYRLVGRTRTLDSAAQEASLNSLAMSGPTQSFSLQMSDNPLTRVRFPPPPYSPQIAGFGSERFPGAILF